MSQLAKTSTVGLGCKGNPYLGELNKQALVLANLPLSWKPCSPAPRQPKTQALHVVAKPHIQAMWAAQRRLKELAEGTLLQRVFDAFRRFRNFSLQSRNLRNRCSRARREKLHGYIVEAQQAANRQDMGSIYRIIRHIAPKNRRMPVNIRSEEGHLLSASAQFAAIMDYFGKAYDSPKPPPMVPSGVDLALTVDEVRDAIDSLKPGKTVPDGSLPAELWRLCPRGVCRISAQPAADGGRCSTALPA